MWPQVDGVEVFLMYHAESPHWVGMWRYLQCESLSCTSLNGWGEVFAVCHSVSPQSVGV